MLKKLLVILLVVSLCLAEETSQEEGRKKLIRYKHKYHFLHHRGILYYLAFLAIKAKIVFLIGTMITFVMFATKLGGLIKYGTYYLAQQKNREPEKIYIQSEPHPTYVSTPEVYDSHEHDHEHYYGRELGDSIFENFDIYQNVIKTLDITNLAFESMNMKPECRKRFICEADYRARNSSLLALGLYMFSDEGLNKYRTEDTIDNFEDCANLFADCDEMPEHMNSLSV